MYGQNFDSDNLLPEMNVNAIGAYAEASSNKKNTQSSDPLIAKLNHVIHLLEEQKDDKTSRVNEEILLYLFLGIFVIFIVDSFTRLGKYTR